MQRLEAAARAKAAAAARRVLEDAKAAAARATADAQSACKASERRFHAAHVSFPYAKALHRGAQLSGFEELDQCYAAGTIPMAYCEPGVSSGGCVQRVAPSRWGGMRVFLRHSDARSADAVVVVELADDQAFVYALRLDGVDDMHPSVGGFVATPRAEWEAKRAGYDLLTDSPTDPTAVYVLSAVRRAVQSNWTAGRAPLSL